MYYRAIGINVLLGHKARSDGARKTHQPGLFIYACEKRTQIEKILSTAFYAANYAGLNEPLVPVLNQQMSSLYVPLGGPSCTVHTTDLKFLLFIL